MAEPGLWSATLPPEPSAGVATTAAKPDPPVPRGQTGPADRGHATGAQIVDWSAAEADPPGPPLPRQPDPTPPRGQPRPAGNGPHATSTRIR
ncbi:hypothetical protein [Asanoa sp. NPDC050611]|uniref:hypothetical protein n=1 Tax=Asanoa sp. NPDC050611 TaxID=3157098 RepID=UPI0033DEC60D